MYISGSQNFVAWNREVQGKFPGVVYPIRGGLCNLEELFLERFRLTNELLGSIVSCGKRCLLTYCDNCRVFKISERFLLDIYTSIGLPFQRFF